jgi:hypothetical protein
MQCVSGYQARCRAQPDFLESEDLAYFSSPETPDTASCIAKCDADSQCVGVNFVVSGEDPSDPSFINPPYCLLYASIGSVDFNDHGLNGQGINLYLKCPF